MQKKFLGLFVASLMLCLAACGDETTINEVTSINTVVSVEKLDKCTDGNDGTFIYVSDSSAVYFCADGQWQTLNGKDGDTVRSIDTLIIKVVDTLVLRDTLLSFDTLVIKETLEGLNGEGCSASDTVSEDGLKGINIDCGGTRSGTIWNGKDGADGKSAYETAVENGFTGTEEEWIESLRVESSSSEKGSYETSSSVASSSSSKIAWDYLNTNISYGEMTDERDGQVYKTVVIGSQTWFAENLNYQVLGSYCYDDNTDACAIFGRLYTWGTAKTACPEGWHLPSKDEYSTMYASASNSYSNILSAHYSGSNSSGFSLLYGGVRSTSAVYSGLEGSAYLWTSSMGSEKPYGIGPFVVGNNFYMAEYYSNSAGLAVRCLKD